MRRAHAPRHRPPGRCPRHVAPVARHEPGPPLLLLTDRITCACATHIVPEGEGVRADLAAAHITRKPMRVLGHGNVRGIDLDVDFLGTDFSKLKDSRFQGWFVGAGVSYGYDWVLNKH